MKEYKYDYKTIHVDKDVWIYLKQLALDREESIKNTIRDIVEGKLRVKKI